MTNEQEFELIRKFAEANCPTAPGEAVNFAMGQLAGQQIGCPPDQLLAFSLGLMTGLSPMAAQHNIKMAAPTLIYVVAAFARGEVVDMETYAEMVERCKSLPAAVADLQRQIRGEAGNGDAAQG